MQSNRRLCAKIWVAGRLRLSKSLRTRTLNAAWTLAAVVLLAPLAWAETGTSPDLDLSDFRGKVLVVDFWASWCVPCRRSFPWLNVMQDKYAEDGLVIVGVNLDRERVSATAFLRDFPARFRITYDPAATLAEQFGVQGMPSSYVIGRDGTIRSHHIGFKVKRQDDYEAAIVAALEEKSP